MWVGKNVDFTSKHLSIENLISKEAKLTILGWGLRCVTCIFPGPVHLEQQWSIVADFSFLILEKLGLY